MTELLCTLVTFAILCYVFWQLARTNMDVPPNAEKSLGARAALEFAIDNDLPIKSA